jgi:hypothetical protein
MMDERTVEAAEVRNLFQTAGLNPEESSQCMTWTSPELDVPLTDQDQILAELSLEEQGFLRCMGYTVESKVMDTDLLRALYETFWGTVRTQHCLRQHDLAVKEGKYVVAM